MIYNFNNKNIRIPDADIERSMKVLKLTKDEAIQLWLEDEGYLKNEIVEELTKKAKENKILKGAKSDKPRKPIKRERKLDEEKVKIIEILANSLVDSAEILNFDPNSIQITNVGKIIEFKIGKNEYKIDLIKKRPPKK